MYKLFYNDCKDVHLENIKLVYLDPPYSYKSEDNYYGIGETFKEYLSYIKERLEVVKNCLATNFNFVIHVDFKAVHYIKVMCDEIFGRTSFVNEIIWCYSNPSVAKRYFPRKHDNLLWYAQADYIFNQPHIQYTGKLRVGGDTAWSEQKDTNEYLEKGKKLEDWWIDIPALCRNEGEKVGYATQKPLKLMKRIIEALSNEGDNIYDPFCGSGSFLHAGIILKRNCFGADISKEAIDKCEERLAAYDLCS